MSDCKVLNCPLCDALRPSGQIEFSNKILFETENFAIIPSIGPLVVGHMLIVGKSHIERLSNVSARHLNEFKSILDTIAPQSAIPKNFLFIEHGSYDGQKGGGCIEHAHVHVIPGFEAHFNVLDGILKVKDGFDKLDSILNIDFPYILSFNGKGEFRVYEAYNVQSQMMRKAICIKLGLSESDWRVDAKLDLIKHSIEYWNIKILNYGN